MCYVIIEFNLLFKIFEFIIFNIKMYRFFFKKGQNIGVTENIGKFIRVLTVQISK